MLRDARIQKFVVRIIYDRNVKTRLDDILEFGGLRRARAAVVLIGIQMRALQN